MTRLSLLAGCAVILVGCAIAALVLVRTDDGGSSSGAPTTTSPTTSSEPAAPPPPVPTSAPVPDLVFRPRPEATAAARQRCLARRDVVTLGPSAATVRLGRDAEPRLPDGATIDARLVTWEMVKDAAPGESPDPRAWVGELGFRYPVDIRAVDGQPRRGLCLVGGTVVSSYPDQAGEIDDPLGWDRLWHRTAGVSLDTEAPMVIGTRLVRQGDGINLQGRAVDGWAILGVHMQEVHDDCVEADEHTSGRIVDVFLDGCYSGIASRSPDVDGEPGQSVSISHSLIRMQPMLAAYAPDRNGRPSHAHVFKWEDDAPRVVLRDTVIRADALPHSGQRFSLPDDLLCEGATFVWGGEEPLPPQDDAFLRCFDDDGVAPLGDRITTDVSVWDDAAAAWLAARPAA